MGAFTPLLITILPLIPDIAKLTADVIRQIKARNPGMTLDEIFDKADLKFSDNQKKLLADLERLED
jgi:hypothetical protein